MLKSLKCFSRIEIVSCLILILVLSGCNGYSGKLTFSVVNPTAYLFPYKIEKVKSAAIKGIGSFMFLYLGKATEVSDNSRDYHVSFKLETNADRSFSKYMNLRDDDFYLHSFGDFFVSNVYFSDDKEIPHRISAAYVIRFEKLTDTLTKVSVIPVNHKVVTGRRAIPSLGPCGFWHPPVEIDAPSSTVEEYELLLKIGEVLNFKGMPALKIPERIYMTKGGRIVS